MIFNEFQWISIIFNDFKWFPLIYMDFNDSQWFSKILWEPAWRRNASVQPTETLKAYASVRWAPPGLPLFALPNSPNYAVFQRPLPQFNWNPKRKYLCKLGPPQGPLPCLAQLPLFAWFSGCSMIFNEFQWITIIFNEIYRFPLILHGFQWF